MGEKKAVPLRISPQLYEELRAWAEQDLRSVNAQIEVILRDAVQKRKGNARQVRRAS
jgi:hypothetical protein